MTETSSYLNQTHRGDSVLYSVECLGKISFFLMQKLGKISIDFYMNLSFLVAHGFFAKRISHVYLMSNFLGHFLSLVLPALTRDLCHWQRSVIQAVALWLQGKSHSGLG